MTLLYEFVPVFSFEGQYSILKSLISTCVLSYIGSREYWLFDRSQAVIKRRASYPYSSRTLMPLFRGGGAGTPKDVSRTLLRELSQIRSKYTDFAMQSCRQNAFHSTQQTPAESAAARMQRAQHEHLFWCLKIMIVEGNQEITESEGTIVQKHMSSIILGMFQCSTNYR